MKTKMHTNNRREEMMIVFCLRRTRNEHINIQLNRHWKKRHSILMANHELHRHSHGFKWPRLYLNIEYNFNCGNPRTRHTTENGNFMQFVVSILQLHTKQCSGIVPNAFCFVRIVPTLPSRIFHSVQSFEWQERTIKKMDSE